VPNGNLASMGIYIFNRAVLAQRLTEDSLQASSPHDFGQTIIPGMLNRFKVFAYQFSGYWQDIGTIEAYYQANLQLNSGTPDLCLNKDWPVTSGSGQTLVNADTQPGIRNSRIGSGCDIQGTVENSVLFPGVRVERHAVVRNSIIMANSVIGWHSIVDGCIVDEDSRIGRTCFLGFDTNFSYGNQGITVVGKGVDMPDYTVIRRCGRIGPYATRADFMTSEVLAGTLLSRQLATVS
ncbi:MAG: sugar phosphate nucleotidyltransferase, partial [Dehalococcoidia bacterium]|nr:sugar phosphate nucleotidyltransferase [Dehalococcoidia bacterium]